MNKTPKPVKKEANHPQKRYTIGLLTDVLVSSYVAETVRGALESTYAQDANLLCFVGGALDSPDGYWGQSNAIYNLVDIQNVDGIVATSGVLGAFVSVDRLRALYESFAVPVVSIGMELDHIPSVVSENYAGVHAAMVHLVQDHGYRRIVFIKGPEGQQEAEARYQAYCDVLAESGLSVDPALVLPGDFREITGREGISRLLSENGVKFDAIVAANDDMAFGALDALEKRGLHVPYDVAVVGFDNSPRSNFVLPPLTTVEQPVKLMTAEAIKMLLAQLAGEEIPEKVVMPSELVLRQSCGCTTSRVVEAALRSGTPAKVDLLNKEEALEFAVFQQREEILSQMQQAVGDVKGLRSDWAERLLDSFWAALTTESSDEALDDFIPVLDETLHETVIHGNNIEPWQSVISVMRRQIRPYLEGKEREQAEDIWQQARVVVGEVAHWIPSYQAQQAEHRAEILRDLGANIISVFDVDELMSALAYYLPRLGMAGCYLSLYEDPQNHTEMSRLMLAFNEGSRVEIEPGGQLFPTRRLIPENILSPAARYSFIIMPLFFQKEWLGFVLFTIDQPEEMVYETLRAEISSALQGALLMKQEEKRVRQLQTVAEVSTATSTILDAAILLQQVVDLTKERFDLYHAHIYLLNESGDTLNLAAGADEAGRKMVAEGWRIPLAQEQSLVARAARSGKTVTVDNVRLAADWLPNPLLPDTYAEMAVPIMLEDKVVGVLDVQSDKVGGLNELDANLLRSLANHVAVTLTHARLFEETQEALTETNNLYQASRKVNEAADLQEMMIAVAEASSVSQINQVMLGVFERGSLGQIDTLVVTANWHSGQGLLPPAVGVRFSLDVIPYKDLLFSLEPIFIDDVLHDERLDFESMAAIRETHVQSMAILPLWVADRQPGVLLLRAEEVQHFTQAERRLYASLARQVAVAVENQQLLAESQSVLAELEATQSQYTIQSWDSYRKRSSTLTYEQVRFDEALVTENMVEDQYETPQDVVLLPDGDESASPTNGSMQDNVSLRLLPAEHETKLVVPLKIRGEEIGVLGITETAKQRKWSPEEIALVEAIAEQVAQAAENLRLIEETQQAAARETRVNEIGDKIRAAQSLEEALRIAVKEVGISLKVPQTAVKLEISD